MLYAPSSAEVKNFFWHVLWVSLVELLPISQINERPLTLTTTNKRHDGPPGLTWSVTSRLPVIPQLKSLIRRTKETPNMHLVYREGPQRRRLGPVIVNKSSSQDRVIEELQGKFGLGRLERCHRQPDDWLAEGVEGSSRLQRSCAEGGAVEQDKVCCGTDDCCPLVRFFLHTAPALSPSLSLSSDRPRP